MDQVFLQLKALLESFGIKRYGTDYWGAYARHLDLDEHQRGNGTRSRSSAHM
jgi:insertion element IS1 protein InsB